MALNLVSIVNKGIEQAFEELDFALLKTRPIADENGEVQAYRATVVVTADHSNYTRSNGEKVEGVNAGEVLQLTVRNNRMPDVKGMVVGVKLVKPQVHAVYATSAQDSTFATINLSFSAENLLLPDQKGGHQ
ncbi:hypothetical protein [Limosilactobacillus vaginalis]|uniref:hypothetical protein n=1 Tax=Limosilactobacillus vaginalis TaxID=1633 RepID=UPI0025A345A8|nr:hypothetical protein [Limosilactobacillus vaginalis]MDM8304301.1 hypothetical protein [Limosilactobacillus vaginalis]